MTTESTTETDATDNGDDTATESNAEQSTSTDTSTETDDGDGEEDSSTVTPRERELRRLLRKTEKDLKRLTDAEEARKREEMSEVDRLRADLEEANAKLAQTERAALLARISADHGLDAELTERLRGDTEEELVEDAKRLADLVGKRKPTTPPPGQAGIGVKGDDGVPADPVEAYRRATASRRV